MTEKTATLLEGILGAENAALCEEEIRKRSHPDDTPEFRAQLILEVLSRHIRKANIELTHLLLFIHFIEDDNLAEIQGLIESMLAIKVYELDGYQPKS